MSILPRFLLVSTLAALAIGGCSGGKKEQAPAPAAPSAKPVAPTKLNVYIWTNYHSDEALRKFEAANNAKVIIDTYDNNEVIEQKLQSGTAPYDIVVPSDYMVTSLAEQGLLLQLDEARLPGLSNITPQLDWSKLAGAPRYSVPYLFSTTGYAYRTDLVHPEPTTWAPLFDPQYKGHVVMLDDMREDFVAALKLLGMPPNTTDMVQLKAAQKKLIAQKPLVLAYDSSDFAGKIQAGDAWLAHGYSGELARVARESGGKIKYVLPAEGATLAVDNLAIPKAARNVDLAYKFIEFMMNPEVAADTTNTTGYPTANLTARSMIKPELVSDPAVFPSAEVLNRCETMKNLGTITADIDQLWTEIKAH